MSTEVALWRQEGNEFNVFYPPALKLCTVESETEAERTVTTLNELSQLRNAQQQIQH